MRKFFGCLLMCSALVCLGKGPPTKTTQVQLVWDASAGPGVVSYVLFYGVTDSLATEFVVIPANQLTASLELRFNTSYDFFVVAEDSLGGVSEPSNLLRYTTPRR